MKGFIEGRSRAQSTLFPERFDDYVSEDSAVRVIDVFIDDLDISGLGFKTEPNDTGRPAYHPTTMLKIYVYGYLNRIQSSRRLEREAADRQEPDVAQQKTERLEDKISKLREEMERLKKLEVRMLEAPDQQISLTDPDARSMATSGRGTGMVGYNVQTAVDTKHHLIVAHEITNQGHDRKQLHSMAQQAKAMIGSEHLDVVADRGYFRGEEIKACAESGITTYLPKPQTSGNMAKGQFGKRDFIYKQSDDEYECPAGQRAIYRFTRTEAGKQIRRYWSSACTHCSIKARCTDGDYRRISRWEHEVFIRLVELMGIRFRPYRYDFELRYLERDFPQKEQQSTHEYMKYVNPDDLRKKVALIDQDINENLAVIKKQGIRLA